MAKFGVGQLVRHKQYDYRAVVVEFDEICQAGDDWYLRNRTQPDRDQPWYHLLVHGGAHATYAAEENLLEDTSGEQIVHPLVNRLFASFSRGRYARRGELTGS